MSQILDRVLAAARQLGASDVHLRAGLPPIFRIKGDLRTIREVSPLSRESLAQFAVHVMNDRQRADFEQHLDLELAYRTPDGERYRVSLFQQRGSVGMVLRLIPAEVPSLDRLHLPPAVLDLAAHPHGLVLVTGAARSGKSTTLAAMIEHINTQQARHLVTVEDPIEHAFGDRRSVVTQRELGADAASFPRAVRAALRQDPDVLFVSELRDAESADLALTAAGTGCLVLSTLPAADAADAVGRLAELAAAARPAPAQLALAGALRGVVWQRLLPRADGGGMIPALEVLVNAGRVRELLDDPRADAPHRARELRGAIAEGQSHGMMTLDQSLANLVRQRLVTYDEALKHATHPSDFASQFRGRAGAHRAWANGLAVVDDNPGARHDEIESESK